MGPISLFDIFMKEKFYVIQEGKIESEKTYSDKNENYIFKIVCQSMIHFPHHLTKN